MTHQALKYFNLQESHCQCKKKQLVVVKVYFQNVNLGVKLVDAVGPSVCVFFISIFRF